MNDGRCNLSDYNTTSNSSAIRSYTPQLIDWVLFAIYLVIAIWTIFGNVLVIVTIKRNTSMRKTIFKFFVNLAVADIFVCLFGIVDRQMLGLFFNPYYYVKGPVMCRFSQFIITVSLIASVLTLSAISCDRFIAIMFPFHSRITKQRTSLIITIIWAISIIVGIPFLIYHRLEKEQVGLNETLQCKDVWPKKTVYSETLHKCVLYTPAKRIYYTFISVTLFFIPMFIMTTSYALMIWKLWISKSPGERNPANVKVQHKVKKKLLMMICVVILVFICCWTPFQTAILYSQHIYSPITHSKLPEWFKHLNYYGVIIAYTNSALNPIIYGGFNKKFRTAIWQMFKCNCSGGAIKRLRSSTQRTSIFFWRSSKSKNTSLYPLAS